jgi:hypothetical protein
MSRRAIDLRYKNQTAPFPKVPPRVAAEKIVEEAVEQSQLGI